MRYKAFPITFFYLLAFAANSNEVKVPEYFQLKFIHKVCTSESQGDRGFCLGYFTRLVLDIQTRNEAYDAGFVMGQLISTESIREDYGMNEYEYMNTDEYLDIRAAQLENIRSCMSDTPTKLTEKFIKWGEKNQAELSKFYETAINQFINDTYECDYMKTSNEH